MKKQPIFTLLAATALSTAVFLAGCTTAQASSPSPASSTASVVAPSSQSTSSSQSSAGSSSSASQPQDSVDKNDLLGKLTAVNGNTLELELISRPERSNHDDGQEKPDKQKNDEKGSRSSTNQPADGSQSSPDGVGGATVRSGENHSTQAPPAQASFQTSGETAKVTLSEAATITEGREKTSLSLADLQIGDILHVALEQDGSTATAINRFPQSTDKTA